MNVALLGTATLLAHDGDAFLVDCGPGCAPALDTRGVAPAGVAAVLFTDLRALHTLDFPRLLLDGWCRGRRHPLTAYGPPGLDRFCDGVLDAYAVAIDHLLRRARLDSNGVRIDSHEVEPGPVLHRPGLRVVAAAVDRADVEHSLAYRFEADGGAVTVYPTG